MMDFRHASPYVAVTRTGIALELLLLLSAFLTALTGAITGARTAQATAQQEQVLGGTARAAQVAARAVALRPVQRWPALARSVAVWERPLLLGLRLPGFGQRRRE